MFFYTIALVLYNQSLYAAYILYGTKAKSKESSKLYLCTAPHSQPSCVVMGDHHLLLQVMEQCVISHLGLHMLIQHENVTNSLQQDLNYDPQTDDVFVIQATWVVLLILVYSLLFTKRFQHKQRVQSTMKHCQ